MTRRGHAWAPNVRRILVVGLCSAVLVASCGGNPAPKLKAAARFFSGALNEAEAASIFGSKRLGDARLLNDVLSATKLGQSKFGLTLLEFSGSVSMADDLGQKLLAADSGIVTLIGHNENGLLKLKDGSGLVLAGLGTRTGGAKVAVIACNSLDDVTKSAAGIATDIEYEVAFATEARFLEKAAQFDESTPVAQLQSILDDALAEVLSERQFKERIVVGTVVAGVCGGGVSIAIVGMQRPTP